MKKILIILFAIFLGLSGCSNENDKIYVGKVDVLSDYNHDSRDLSLCFFSYEQYDQIQCIIEDEVIAYKYEVEKNIPIVNSQNSKKMYLHEATITFEKQEIQLNEIYMDFDGKIMVFDIGSFILTDVYEKYTNTYNIIVDVMYPEDLIPFSKEVEMDLKVMNLSLMDISLISLKNLNKDCDYQVSATKVKDLVVSSNEAKISEVLKYKTEDNILFMSTYIAYEYAYKTTSVIKNNQYFKLEFDGSKLINKCKEINVSKLVIGENNRYV